MSCDYIHDDDDDDDDAAVLMLSLNCSQGTTNKAEMKNEMKKQKKRGKHAHLLILK